MIKNTYYRIGDYYFESPWLKKYLNEEFAEQFAHTSLTCEEAFKESRKAAKELNDFISEKNITYARKLNKSENPEDIKLLKEKIDMIRVALINRGIPEESYENEEGFKLPSVDDYKKYFLGAVRPYNLKKDIDAASEKGLLTGESYEEESMSQRVMLLLELIETKVKADYQATIMKKSHNDAFEYATTLKSIGIKEIIEINKIINECTGTHVGFKTTNNMITNSEIETTDKKDVYLKMNELIYNYNNVWSEEIPTLTQDSTDEDLSKYHLAICEREARFHIEFETIHPFEDGNGRTGRIIMNEHLLENHLPPLIIPIELRKQYITYIKNKDYKGLGKQMFESIGFSINNMISAYRHDKGIDPDVVDETELGILYDSDDNEKILNLLYKEKKTNH